MENLLLTLLLVWVASAILSIIQKDNWGLILQRVRNLPCLRSFDFHESCRVNFQQVLQPGFSTPKGHSVRLCNLIPILYKLRESN